MGFVEDWNSRHHMNEQELDEHFKKAARLAQTMVWGIIIGTLLMFLLVVAISCYCYKKKRVTPGFVIRPPPDNVAPPNAAPVYPAGTVAYTPGYPGGAPGYPSDTPRYSTEKPAQPPGYDTGKYTQSNL